MAKNKSQEKKEKDVTEKEIQEFHKRILIANSSIIGANELEGSYGKDGSNIANSYYNSNSPEFSKIRQELFEDEVAYNEKAGIFHTPEITDQQVIKNAVEMNQGALSKVNLRSLEEIAREISPDIKIGITPKNMKDKTIKDYKIAIKRANGKPENMSKEDLSFGEFYDFYTKIYSEGSKVNLINESYESRFGGVSEKLFEKYKLKKKSDGSSEEE